MTLSSRFPLILRFRGSCRAGGSLTRDPGLVIAGRAAAMPAPQDRTRRMVGQRRPGHVRLMRLLPGIALPRLRHFINHVVQPGMPFRRHLRALGLAIVDNPAPLAAETPSAERLRLVAFQPVVAVAVIVASSRVRPAARSAAVCRVSRPCQTLIRAARTIASQTTGGKARGHLSEPAISIRGAVDGKRGKPTFSVPDLCQAQNEVALFPRPHNHVPQKGASYQIWARPDPSGEAKCISRV